MRHNISVCSCHRRRRLHFVHCMQMPLKCGNGNSKKRSFRFSKLQVFLFFFILFCLAAPFSLHFLSFFFHSLTHSSIHPFLRVPSLFFVVFSVWSCSLRLVQLQNLLRELSSGSGGQSKSQQK